MDRRAFFRRVAGGFVAAAAAPFVAREFVTLRPASAMTMTLPPMPAGTSFSIRFIKAFDVEVCQMPQRLDILYGMGTVNPADLAVRLID